MAQTEGAYRVDVLTVGESTWATNALRFDTPVDALIYARDLYSRWTAVDKFRVVPSSTPDREAYAIGSEYPSPGALTDAEFAEIEAFMAAGR